MSTSQIYRIYLQDLNSLKFTKTKHVGTESVMIKKQNQLFAYFNRVNPDKVRVFLSPITKKRIYDSIGRYKGEVPIHQSIPEDWTESYS